MHKVFVKILPKFGRLMTFLPLIGAAVLSLSLIRSVTKARQANYQVEEAQLKLDKQVQDFNEIETKIEEVRNEVYVEKQIRDRLGLAKEGEIVVILPEDEVLRRLAPQDESEDEVLPDPNWKKWLHIFDL